MPYGEQAVIRDAVARAICASYGCEWDKQAENGSGLGSHNPLLPARDDFREMATDAIAAHLSALEAAGYEIKEKMCPFGFRKECGRRGGSYSCSQCESSEATAGRPEAMTRVGLMLRTPSGGVYSTAEDVARDREKAFKKFGVHGAQFCEPHGFWLSLFDEFLLGGRLIEVYAPDPKEKRECLHLINQIGFS